MAAQICASKVRFRTKADARRRRDVHRREGYRYFVYECPCCRGFHLTHTPPGDWREQRRAL